MDQENQISVDINSADEESLTKLQGVGARLARRIIEERPFASIDDLTRVRGISENDVERLRPFLSITDTPQESQVLDEMVVNEPDDLDKLEATEVASETLTSENSLMNDQEQAQEGQDNAKELAAEDQPDEVDVTATPEPSETNQDDEIPSEEQSQTEIETGQPEEFIEVPEIEDQEPEPVAEIDQEPLPDELIPTKEATQEKPVTQPGYITRGGACSLVLIGGFITLLLAVAVTLGIISSINQGRLNYASPSQITTLQSQIDTLTTQSQTLAKDIDGMRTRMDNLESLSGQVSEMETEINTMQADISELQVQIAANQAAYDQLALQIEDIENQIENLISQGDRFESFLSGLRTLMQELFPQTPETEEIP